MIESIAPAQPGHICPNTGRVAVLVSDYANSDLNGDAWAYWYNAANEAMGLDPWSLVECIDPHANGRDFDVCFASGTFKTVGGQMTVYLHASDAARLALEKAGKAGQVNPQA